jgi:hypothetical protein
MKQPGKVIIQFCKVGTVVLDSLVCVSKVTGLVYKSFS